MRVLAAILPQTRRVALDVAGIVRRPVERRRQHQHEAIGFAHQVASERRHGLRRTLRRRYARQHRPGLRDGVDAALGIGVGSQRCAVVIIGAQIPFAVPRRCQCRFQCRRVGTPCRRAGVVLLAGPCVGEGRKRQQRRVQEPAEPHAFAPAAFADAAHAVVPVARAHQRQAVDAGGEAVVQRPRAMLEQGPALVGDGRREEPIVLRRRQHRCGQEPGVLVQHRRVPRRLDVVRGGVGEPGAVVGNPRPHAHAGPGQPPVLHVAFQELPARRAQQVFAHQVRAGCDQRGAILQLVAEPVGPARLVEPGARPRPAGERLVQQAAIQHDVHAAVRGLHHQRAQHAVPK